jgi:hypothetical protein
VGAFLLDGVELLGAGHVQAAAGRAAAGAGSVVVTGPSVHSGTDMIEDRDDDGLGALGTAGRAHRPGDARDGAPRRPLPRLFAGLLVATGLALAGRAPTRVPAQASTAAQAVIGVVIGVLAQPATLGAVAQGWLPVLLVTVGTLAVSMGAGLLMGAVARGHPR